MPSQKSSKNSNPNERVFYTAGFDKVVTLPVDAVVQMPSKCQAKRLVLCTFFDPAKPHQSCPLKKKCNFVHADLRKAIQIQVVHVNYAWQSPTEVSYERFPEGMSLEVAPPGCKHIVDSMDSSLALKTKALGSTRLPLQHCAHYYYTRQCDLGSDCMFVHAVYVDPEAAPLQRAPVPRDMGRGRDHLAAAPAAGAGAEAVPKVAVGVSPQPKPAQQEELITVVGCECDEASMSRDSPAPQWFLASNRSSSDEELVPASSASDAGTMEAPRARSMSSSSNSSCGADSPASASVPAAARPPVVAMRYRHDPYSIAGQRMIAVRAS